MATSEGRITSKAAELLWSLPLAIDTYCHFTLAFILRRIQSASPHELLRVDVLYRQSTIISAILGVRTIHYIFETALLIRTGGDRVWCDSGDSRHLCLSTIWTVDISDR